MKWFYCVMLLMLVLLVGCFLLLRKATQRIRDLEVELSTLRELFEVQREELNNVGSQGEGIV